MKKPLLLIFFILPFLSKAQLSLSWNTYLDLELTKAGSLSNYYYNEIHFRHIDWRFDLARWDVLGNLEFNNQFSLNTQLTVQRNRGQRIGILKDLEAYDLILSQFNFSWKAKNQKLKVKVGRFITPFGSFYQKQINKDRAIIPLPLAYSYYVNISPKIGFAPDLREDGLRVDGRLEWGEPTLYYLGYKTGVSVEFGKPYKLWGTVALVNGGLNLSGALNDEIQLGLISRLKFHPFYFGEFGASFAIGHFFETSEFSTSEINNSQFRQVMLGFDYKLGWSFFEVSGELIATSYKNPVWSLTENQFEGNNDIFRTNFNSFSSYLDFKYEPPFLSGSFIAYRFDLLTFSNFENSNGQKESWDNDVIRHVLSLGYKINGFLQIKTAFSTQSVDNKAWDQHQRTFRTMLTFFL